MSERYGDRLKIIASSNSAPNKTGFPLMKMGLEMTGKEGQKNVLIVPTAKRKIETYEGAVSGAREALVKKLGQKAVVLHGFEEIPNEAELREKIEAADMIHVSGGDSDYMMETWRQYRIDRMLGKRALEGMVWTGTSAGSIAPMTWGHSDSLSYRVEEDELWDYIRVDGLSLVPYAITPHYNTAPRGVRRDRSFHEMLAREYDPAIAGFGIDDGAAMVISDNEMSAVAMRPEATVWNVMMDPERRILIDSVSAKYIGER
jgi:peptidase E